MVGGDLIVATYKQGNSSNGDDMRFERRDSGNATVPSGGPCVYEFTSPEDSLSVMDNYTNSSTLRDIMAAAAEVVGGMCGSLQIPAPTSWLVGGSALAPLSSPNALHLSPGKLS